MGVLLVGLGKMPLYTAVGCRHKSHQGINRQNRISLENNDMLKQTNKKNHLNVPCWQNV